MFSSGMVGWQEATDAHVCQQVQRKSAPYSLAIAEELLLHHMDLSGCRRIEWWSDGGRHFRCHSSISTICLRGIEALAGKSKCSQLNPVVQIQFGIPNHFKNICDGGHSYVRSLLQEASMRQTISTLAEFVVAMRSLHAEHKATEHWRRKARIPITFHDWFPKLDRKTFIQQYVRSWKPASFLLPISTCQAYECRLNDRRRLRNPLYLSPKGIYTGLDFKSSMLCNGHRVPNDRVCLPADDPSIQERADHAEPEEGDAEEQADIAHEVAEDFAFANAEPGNGTIEMAVQLFKGWRSSYRKQQPEKKEFEEIASIWSKMRGMWEKTGVSLLPPRSRRSVAAQQALQSKWAASRRLQPIAAVPAGPSPGAASASADGGAAGT